jgi:hypothetical protein
MRNVYNFFVGRNEGKRTLGGPRGRWEDNIIGSWGNSLGICGLDSSD